VNHFSAGFLALRPGGFAVQVRDYVRQDRKTIKLVPMAHVADSAFYRNISKSFPNGSLILMEGVTDNQNLLTNKISYKRMASSLGLSEQQKEFRPSGVKIVRADIDVEEFEPETIDLLNLTMLIHAKGLNAQTISQLFNFSAEEGFEEQLFDDLLRKRNRHLLDELQDRLSESDYIIVPWGAAHMPEIAREIQKSGFSLKRSQEYVAVRFHSRAKH
jgi:hypothetical protein